MKPTQQPLIGKHVRITNADNQTLVGKEGVVQDESKHTITINDQTIIKDHINITITINNQQINGKTINKTITERIKGNKK